MPDEIAPEPSGPPGEAASGTAAAPAHDQVVEVKVNLSRDAFDTLQKLARDHNMTITEALHRAIGALAFFYENEGKLLVEPRLGMSPRVVTFTR
jgi:hypothetical protein